jgi:uncharacterized protein YndB with AHSA1/START domain
VRWVRLRRRLDAEAERVYRAWSQPEDLARWFPYRVEGSLAVGTRTVLVWPTQRVWWDVTLAEPNRRFAFRWPWLPDDSLVTAVTVAIEPRGMGSTIELEDGPFDTSDPRQLEAYAEAREGWGEALAMFRAYVDFSVDVRWR